MKRPVRDAILLTLIIASAPHSTSVHAQSCPATVWADEFDGSTLDLTRWSYQVGDGCAEGICGWGNNELQTYQEANVTVSNGSLKIEARRERIRNKNYTSGRIRSLGKGEWTFGRFEARIRLTQGQGIWPAFWMLPTDEVYGGWPQSGEIDIMENVGHEPDIVHGTIHYGPPYPNNQNSGASFRLHEGVFADGFHTFAIEKDAGEIRWFVDDILYSTKTSADTSPHGWPFDERFHFLLNVAVGGNWPGSPDATTVFPQILEVDYVRVLDGHRPHITGERIVSHQESGVTYTVGNAPSGSSYAWTVPAGATIVSGQNTASIVVDWGMSGGDVVAQVSSGCGTGELRIPVVVEQPFAREFSFENFDDPANMTLNLATGTLQEVSNPDASGINSSALSGRYTRNSSEQYDVLAYDVAVISDASLYSTNQKKFYIDLYTNAPLGSTVLLQLEDGSRATSSNYPTGRHSRYQAQTTVQNAWERLELPLLDRPDPSTSDSGVNKLILLFAPNTLTGHVYTIDNLDSYAVASGGGSAPAAPTALSATAVSSAQIDLNWTDEAGDEDGFTIERSPDGQAFGVVATVGPNVTSFSNSGLSASTTYYYRVRAFNGHGPSAYSNVATATTSGSGGTSTTMHVVSIEAGAQSAGKGAKRGYATVAVVDNLGNPVSGASVVGTFTGDFNESAAGTTASNGAATLTTNGTKKGGVTFTFCVDDVTHGSLAYDAGSNAITCTGGAGKNAQDVAAEAPERFALDQNYPNPFNPSTEIRFSLPATTDVTLRVFDLLGQVVATLVDGTRSAGTHTVAFDAGDLATGTYVYRIQAGDFSEVRKMVLVR